MVEIIIWKLKSGDSFHLNFQRVVTTNYQVLVRREEHFPAQTGNILDNFYDFKCSRWSQWGASNPCNYLMIKIPIFILWTSVLWLSIIINYQPSFILELILQWITFGCRRRTKTWRIISTSFIDLLAGCEERESVVRVNRAASGAGDNVFMFTTSSRPSECILVIKCKYLQMKCIVVIQVTQVVSPLSSRGLLPCSDSSQNQIRFSSFDFKTDSLTYVS